MSLWIPIKAKPWDVFVLKPFTLSLGRKPHFQEYQYFKPVLATEGTPHCAPGCPSEEQIISNQCPIKSSSKNPNFYNSRHNFSPIKCGSNASSQRQDLCLPFLHPRHLPQCLVHRRHSKVIRQNQTNLPSHWIMWDPAGSCGTRNIPPSFSVSSANGSPPGSLPFSHLPTPLETTNPSTSCGVPYLRPCTGVIMECGIPQPIPWKVHFILRPRRKEKNPSALCSTCQRHVSPSRHFQSR